MACKLKPPLIGSRTDLAGEAMDETGDNGGKLCGEQRRDGATDKGEDDDEGEEEERRKSANNGGEQPNFREICGQDEVGDVPMDATYGETSGNGALLTDPLVDSTPKGDISAASPVLITPSGGLAYLEEKTNFCLSIFPLFRHLDLGQSSSLQTLSISPTPNDGQVEFHSSEVLTDLSGR